MVLIARMKMRFFLIILLVLSFNAAQAEPTEVKITWKGDYAHNSSKHWSKDNPYDSGFSKNFKNGAPDEFGEVKKNGELNAFIYSPKNAKGPVPFVILLHGATASAHSAKSGPLTLPICSTRKVSACWCSTASPRAT